MKNFLLFNKQAKIGDNCNVCIQCSSQLSGVQLKLQLISSVRKQNENYTYTKEFNN